jgi:hypothetical protein
MTEYVDGVRPSSMVGVWIAQRAAEHGVPVSAGLVCETAVDKLGMTGATLTVLSRAGDSELRCHTDELGEKLAEMHVILGEGPAVDVWPDQAPVLVTDLDDRMWQRRWPAFAPSARTAGVRALYTLPMVVGVIRVGVLALHDVRPRPIDVTTVADVLAFATIARSLLLDEQAGLAAPDGDGLAGPPLHHPQVHQATGMISAQLEVTMEDALARLRARAFADQRPLGEVADDVVARRLRFSQEKRPK